MITLSNRFFLWPLVFTAQIVMGSPGVDQNTSTLSDQRKNYIAAKAALNSGDQVAYQLLRQKLTEYPLIPYLDYRELYQQLKQLPYKQLDQFLSHYRDTYVEKLMLRQWLSLLASRQLWHDYLNYYVPTLKSASYECWYLWSRYQTGNLKALKKTEKLWNVANSQPAACDPLFKQWRQKDYLTRELVWQRYRKSLLAGNHKIANYLTRYMSDSTSRLAIKFQKTLLNPASLRKISEYRDKSPQMQDIVFYGLRRYATTNPEKAWKLWLNYQVLHSFSDRQVKALYYQIAKKYAYQDNEEGVLRQLNNMSSEGQVKVIEILLRSQLRQQNWHAVLKWIGLLPEAEAQSDRWRYWRARANEALLLPRKSYQPVYKQLAQVRSFYGFLAADLLEINYSLQHTPTIIEPQTLVSLKTLPGLLRARELYFFGQLHHARQEWSFTTRDLSVDQYQAVAKIADEWGWYRKSIESMSAAKAWDDLKIRFPFAHETIIRRQAKQTNLPMALIFAIARQESAWEADAQSRAGAMGLMQLLPSTAKATATKAGLYHKKADLLQPEHNISLGSRYISELLAKYNNHRVPAIAAYNAGPGRVNRWLKKSDQQLPQDIWIETIPFNETRKYVQNVLLYKVVYAYRMGEKIPLLTQNEVKSLL